MPTRIISRFSSRAPSVTITPFGAPSEPEVYWRNATDDDRRGERRAGIGRTDPIASLAIHESFAIAGICDKNGCAAVTTARVESTTFAPDCSTMPIRRG